MKKKLFVLLMMICVTIMYPQANKGKYNAINDYLTVLVKDTTKTIVIVKEKISPNEALRLFSGGKLNNIPFSRVNGIEERLGGILEPLYKENDFQKMRKKYQNDANEGRSYFAKNTRWNSADFKLKTIFYETFDTIIFKRGKGIPIYRYTTQMIALSEPMYYKGRKYLVIAVGIGDTTPIGYLNNYIIIMKKINNKWQVIQRGEKYWVD
ncbi:hypothetical protein [Flavobacterium lipolyticum]|uniref:DUF4829 domain-containing protein n=1 Tax=Flavobacterium lipolyticum TaxID=2893754 RepID=A0ABS8M471_9FLAO|nr:hypothetical protein [Flavobacterium sp. F-126]MCC9019616.1 hypothetical protein [Flavobacterium sp. F-126]